MSLIPMVTAAGSSNDPNAVKLTGDQSIDGVKTFTSIPVLPDSNPTTDDQAARKAYVDAVALGLTIKDSVDAATTANITLSGEQTIDSFSVTAGMRVLVKNQSTGSQNGIYVAAAGAWSRSTDFDSAPGEVKTGAFTSVLNGTANGNTQWVLTTPAPITLDTTALSFSRLSQPTSYTGGDGIAVSGTDIAADLKTNGGLAIDTAQLKANVDNSSLEVNTANNTLRVKASGVTNAMLAGSIADSKLSTISTANKVAWNAVNKSGSTIGSIANVNAGSPSDQQVLSWDAATSKWIARTVSGGSAGSASTTILDVDVLSDSGVARTWTNMPAGVTEFLGNVYARVKIDLSTATQYRLVVNQSVAGFSTADINLQYSTNNSTYQAADTAAAGELAVGAGTGTKVGAWANLVAGAKSDVWLRIVGKEGDGIVDPVFRRVSIQFKVPGGDTIISLPVVTLDDQSAAMPNSRRLAAGTGISLTDGGAAGPLTVASTILDLDDLTDVDLTTPPTDGQALVFSDDTTYQASYSALAWNGNDYKSGNFGVNEMAVLIYLFAGQAEGVTADGTTITTIDQAGTSNLHCALVNIPGGGGRSTMIISDSVASTSAGLEAILQSEVDPSATVDNFKANFLTYSAGASYGGGTLTGFEQAGTVTAVSGATSPATLTRVPGDQKFIPGDIPTSKHFGTGLYDSEEDTPQTVPTGVETLLNVDSNTIFPVNGWHTDGSHTINQESGNIVGGHGILSVIDDAGEVIPSAVLKMQHSEPGDVWVTDFVGLGGSLAFPFDSDATSNQQGYRFSIEHAAGTDVDLFPRVDIYWAE